MIIVIRMKKTWIEWGEDLFIYIFMFEKYHKTAHKINSRQRHYLFCFNHFSCFTLVERKHPKHIKCLFYCTSLLEISITIHICKGRESEISISAALYTPNITVLQLYSNKTKQEFEPGFIQHSDFCSGNLHYEGRTKH